MKPLTLDEIQTIKNNAKETFAKIQDERDQYKEIFNIMQPLLATISLALYGNDSSDVDLVKLINDAVNFINGNQQGVKH